MEIANRTAADRVFEEVSKHFSNLLKKNVQLTEINTRALDVWNRTWIGKRNPPNGGWDWSEHTKHNNKKFLKRYFNTAIWHEAVLCGLSLGHISRDDSHVWIDLIEGSPSESHPLRGYVLKIIIATHIEYALAIKKKKVVIADPVVGLKKTYEKLGFCCTDKNKFKRPVCQKEVSK